jgi:hypothetical protein
MPLGFACQITVYGNLYVSNTPVTDTYSGGGNRTSYVSIGGGGSLTAVNSEFQVDSLSFGSGSGGWIGYCSLPNLSISSDTIYAIANNDFSSGSVTASGDSEAVIRLENNWWGTTDPNVIEAKITHHFDDPSRPWVYYIPCLTEAPLDPTGEDFFITRKSIALDNIYSITDGIFTDCYFTSLLEWLPLNTLDPLRDVLPFGDELNSVFGNSLETNAGWVSLGPGYRLEYLGFKEQGQWSRLGQVIDPAYGMLIFEAGSGLREWRLRELETDSVAVFEYHSSDPNKVQDDFTVSLKYRWRCLGLAKDDSVAWLVNNMDFLVSLVETGVTEVVSTAAEISTVLFIWNGMADNFELYGVGESLLPEDSSLKAWMYANLVFERPDKTQLGIVGPVFGGWPGQAPLKSGLYDSYQQVAQSGSEVVSLPVGEPVQVRLELKTHAEAKGAAESYAGIIGYEIRIDDPAAGEPLVFSGIDPSPNDLDLARGFSSSLLQAAQTEAFLIGSVYTEETFGESNSINESGVVVLPIDANSPISAVLVPVYLVPQMKTVQLHLDAYWSEGSDLSNTCVEFMLVDDANNLLVDGGIASELFGSGQPTGPFSGLDRHSGVYELQLDIPNLPSGNYALTIMYGEPNYAEPNSCLVVQGLSVDTDPNIMISMTGDFNLDGNVNWVDLEELLDSWISPVPLTEKDLHLDGFIDLKDFAIFAEHWLHNTVP